MADGVGGWNGVGVDPALYSKELCKNLSKNYEIWELSNDIDKNNKNKKGGISSITSTTLKNLLINSVQETKSLGSSTITTLLLDNVKKVLYTAYLGDSLYMILRLNSNGKYILLYKSEDQTHGFNAPFQVGQGGDNPRLAKTNKHDMEEKDLIILASDGYYSILP